MSFQRQEKTLLYSFFGNSLRGKDRSDMRKPIIILRKQKNAAIIIMSAVILLIGILIIYDRKNSKTDIPVFASQNEASAPNDTIEDLLGKLMD